MTIPFSGIVTPYSIAFTSPTGKMINVTETHSHFKEMCDLVRQIQKALKEGDAGQAAELHQTLADLAEPARLIEQASGGSIVVRDGVVYFHDEAIHNSVTERILWGLREGYDMNSYMQFLSNLMENPSKRAVDELYSFMERNNMGITEDGYIIAYKRVRGDYKDIYTGKIDHSIGAKPWMPRNKVDDEKTRTCSQGFHFCAMSYLPSYGAGPGNRIVIVKVNPKDVVSIPVDYDHAKARCNTYEVIGEYEGSDKDDILATKPIWKDSDWQSDFDDDDDFDENDDDFDENDDEYDENDDEYDDDWDDKEDEEFEEEQGYCSNPRIVVETPFDETPFIRSAPALVKEIIYFQKDDDGGSTVNVSTAHVIWNDGVVTKSNSTKDFQDLSRLLQDYPKDSMRPVVRVRRVT